VIALRVQAVSQLEACSRLLSLIYLSVCSCQVSKNIYILVIVLKLFAMSLQLYPLQRNWQTMWTRYELYIWGQACKVRPPLWSSGQSSWLQNGDVLCFLWGTNLIDTVYYVEESRPPVWSSGQSSWLQIQRSVFDSLRYHICWEVIGLERGPLSLVSIIEDLLGRKSSGFCLENRDYGSRDPSRCTCGTLYPQMLALTSPTSVSLSVDVVRSRTQATEFSLV
jgi:hypothetical protein